MIKRTPFSIFLVLLFLDQALAADWPQWRGPNRTGVSEETGLLQSWPPAGPPLLWTFRDAGVGFSSMSIVGDRLYSMGAEGDKEYVYAVDLNTRKKLWSVEVGDRFSPGGLYEGPRSTPTVNGQFLYAIGGYGNLVCVQAASGKKVWSQGLVADLGGGIERYGYCESPLIDDDLLVVTPGGEKGTIAAFDKKTGDLKWRSLDCTYTHTSYSSMIVVQAGGVRQYVQIPNAERGMHAVGVSASDGKLLWEFPFPEAVATPIFWNDCLYVSSLSGCRLVKLTSEGDQFKAERVYANNEMQNHHGGVILVGGYLYGWSNKGGWTCQDFKTGKAVWKKNLGLGRGSVIYADGCLCCYHEDAGDVLLIKADPAGGQERGRFRIPETKLPGRVFTHPVVANGKLYLRDQELIFCYDVHKPQRKRK